MPEDEDVDYRDGEPVVPHAMAEPMTLDRLRALVPEHGSSQPVDCSTDGSASACAEPPMPERLSDDQLDRLRELLDKATPGPWVCEETWPGSGLVALRGDPPEGFTVAAQLRPEDGQLIEAAVNALPALLAENEQLQADLDRAKGDRGVLGVEAGPLRAERDDARRDAARENARIVKVATERNYLSDENMKLRADLEATELEVETRGETIDRLRAERYAPCPTGCGCRTPDDPDRNDCACDGPCTMSEDWPVSFQVEVDRLRADLGEAAQVRLAAGQQIDQLRAENEAWAVRWQEQFDRAERAETTDPGPSQPTDCSSDAAAGLRGPGETPQSVCPHIVTDGTTSHCALAEGQVREVERQRDELAGAVRDIAALLTVFGSRVNLQVVARRLVSVCDRAEGKD